MNRTLSDVTVLFVCQESGEQMSSSLAARLNEREAELRQRQQETSEREAEHVKVAQQLDTLDRQHKDMVEELRTAKDKVSVCQGQCVARSLYVKVRPVHVRVSASLCCGPCCLRLAFVGHVFGGGASAPGRHAGEVQGHAAASETRQQGSVRQAGGTRERRAATDHVS